MIKLLSVAVFAGFLFVEPADGQSISIKPLPFKPAFPSLQPVCWTDWFDRDDPSGTGDWELLSGLQKAYPGKICPNPTDIEVQTLSGQSLAAAGEVIYKADTTYGFICRNIDQPDKYCLDYRVRFRCPASYCDPGVCWTPWFDRDNPSGTGDWELLSGLQTAYPGKICPNPTDIEVQTLSGQSLAAAGEVIYKADTTTGFICRNVDQPDKYCKDYRVRFSCPPSFCSTAVCWTPWFDRDDPSGTGDWETLSSLKAAYPGKICDTPIYIEAVVVGTNTPASSTGENFLTFSPTEGFVCRKLDQKDGKCLDYKVRFGCSCD